MRVIEAVATAVGVILMHRLFCLGLCVTRAIEGLKVCINGIIFDCHILNIGKRNVLY